MAVKEFCIVPSYVDVVSMASSDSGKIMIAYQIGEEDIKFCYAKDFIERMQTCRYVDAITSIINELDNILGGDDNDGKD